MAAFRRDLLGFDVPTWSFDLSPATPPLNRLKKMWREGRPTFGAIATIPSIQTVQIMAQSLDWIIIDLEHGPIDLARPMR